MPDFYSFFADLQWITAYTGDQKAVLYGTNFGGAISLLPLARKDSGKKTIPPQQYEVLFTQPGHFTVGRLEEEDKMVWRTESRKTWLTNGWRWDVKVAVNRRTGTTATFKGLSPEMRGCFYPEEHPLEFFPAYSESNCVLECAWRDAKDKCGCVPWFLGRDHFPSSPLCTLSGNSCFRARVHARYDFHGPCEKKCLTDCERVEYVLESNKRHYTLVERDVDYVEEIFEKAVKKVLDNSTWEISQQM